MSNSHDYELKLEYQTEEGQIKSYSELVHSYRAGFKALAAWLWKNESNDYKLISATIREI